MTPLRQRMIEDMQLRGLAPATQRAYLQAVQYFAQHFGTSPDQLTEEHLRQYFLYLRNDKRVSRSTSTIALCAISSLSTPCTAPGQCWSLSARPSSTNSPSS